MENEKPGDKGIHSLKPGDHLCCLYETDDQYRTVLSQFLRQGLDQNEKVLYITDARSVETVLEYLRADGVDVESALGRGQLNILPTQETYLRGGTFDPGEMIDLMRSETEQALSQGYGAFRLTGEMTWAMRDRPGSDRLIEYEARLNDFAPGSRCLSLCQYDMRRFAPAFLLDVLRTHPQTLIGTDICDNPHYVRPSIILGKDRAASDLRHWMQDMVNRHETDAALRDSETYFREITENASDMIVIVDEKGSITYASPSVERFLGYRPEELIGKSTFDFIHAEDIQRAMLDFSESVRMEETAIPNSFRVLHKDGSVRIIEGLGKNLLHHPTVSGFIMNFHDITERREAEEVQRETDERYRTLFEESLNPIFMVDEGGRYIDLNKPAAEFMECDREDLIGKEVWEFTPLDLAEKQKRQHYHFLSPRTIETEYAIHGVVKTLLLNVVPVTLSGKTILYGIGHNITESKNAEKALQQSEEKYRDLVENINQAIIATDENGILTYASPRIEHIGGYSAQEVIGRSPFDFIYEDDIAFARERFKKLISGETGMVEYRVVTKTGEIRWVQTFNRPIFKDNQLAGFRGVITDITGKKKSEIALKESEERYRTLVETITDAVVIADPDGKLTYLNPEYEKISGYPAKDLMGRSFTELLPPEHIESTLERFRRGLSGEETPIEEISIVHKDGSQVPVEINSTTLFDAEGKLVGRIGVVRDISKRKSLEARLLQTQRLESIGILAGGIAHDFENILSIIRGFTDIAIREVPVKSSARQNLDRALQGIQRAADLVKQIISFSRQSKLERRPVLVSPIAEDTVSLLKASLPSTIEIRLDVQMDSGTVYADPTQIHQVLMNLCTNAAHAMREKGGILEVSLSEVEMDAAALVGLPDISPGDYLRMTVSDTGEGIPPEVLDRIFDPYFSTKERGEGAGLGLSVVHGIMRSHGGAITVRSKPRKGTTFHVYLPLLKHRAEPEEQIGVYEPLPGGNERILFVDDEVDMLFLVGQFLESLGYEVITRANGMDALALFREQPDRFDLVITDMTLPGMTGERLAEQIKKIRRDTPIILCTGFGEDITEERARKMGIREVILKPLVNIDLTKTIRKVLDEK